MRFQRVGSFTKGFAAVRAGQIRPCRQILPGSGFFVLAAPPAAEIARDLRNALISSGMPEAQAKSLVATVRERGYRLGLAPAEVVIEP